jgi:hypothetical protein
MAVNVKNVLKALPQIPQTRYVTHLFDLYKGCEQKTNCVEYN